MVFSKYTDLLPKEVLNEDTAELQRPDEEAVKEVSHVAMQCAKTSWCYYDDHKYFLLFLELCKMFKLSVKVSLVTIISIRNKLFVTTRYSVFTLTLLSLNESVNPSTSKLVSSVANREDPCCSGEAGVSKDCCCHACKSCRQTSSCTIHQVRITIWTVSIPVWYTEINRERWIVLQLWVHVLVTSCWI